MEYSRDNISRPSNSFWAQMGDWKESIVNFASQTAKHSLKLLKFVLQDAIDLHKNMVSWETVGILFATLPLQQLAYKVDEPLHSLFYDRLLHKNTNQAPYLITRIGLKGYKRLRLLMIVLSIWHPSITVRATNLLVVQGSSILSITKRIIKQLINHFAQEASLRPSSERFIQGMKYYGGNPSGHITQASFALTVYGKDHGSAWLTALSIQNILTCIISIIENRHYLSQVIDGVALGTIYGLAARKTRPKWEEFLREEEREVNKSNFVHHKMSLDAIE